MISRREITKKDISIPHPDPQSCLLYTSYSFTEAEGGQYLFNCTNVNLLRWFSVPGSRWPGSDLKEKPDLFRPKINVFDLLICSLNVDQSIYWKKLSTFQGFWIHGCSSDWIRSKASLNSGSRSANLNGNDGSRSFII